MIIALILIPLITVIVLIAFCSISFIWWVGGFERIYRLYVSITKPYAYINLLNLVLL